MFYGSGLKSNDQHFNNPRYGEEMQYVKLDGSIGDCEPVLPSFDGLKEIVDGEVTYHLPRIDEEDSLHELVSHVMGIIAMKPFYIAETDIPWMLTFMDGFRDFAEQQENIPGLRLGFDMKTVKGWALSGTKQTYSEYQVSEPNFIDLSRKFTCIDVIINHLYGFEIITHITSDNPDHERFRDESILVAGAVFGFESDYRATMPQLPKDSLDFIYERRFKTVMSQHYFRGAQGFFTVPKGMAVEFDFETNGFALKEGDTAMFQVERFYTTDGGWRDGYTPSGVTLISDSKLDYAYRFIPVLRATLIENKQPDGQSLFINLPINWITHIVKMPYGLGEREFSITKIINHENPPVIDQKHEQKVYDHVKLKANEDADTMDAILRDLYPHR